ncbi:MAG: prolyl oligopeptidase family serine peptidase [Candidatus Aminicenantes bacterium]|jgi:predicted peptidase
MTIFFSLQLRQIVAIIGFLGYVFIPVTAQKDASSPQNVEILPYPPNSDERWNPIESFKKRAPNLIKQYEAFIHTNDQGEAMPYRLFIPSKLEAGREYPLVVFLHSSSGSGIDNEKQLQRANWFGGLVWALPENQERFPCFVVAPQSDFNWPCVILKEGERPQLCPGLGKGARLAFEIIDKLLVKYPIDRSRVYVTGHSMGGAGTWHMIAHRSNFFAAAVPVCGLPDFETASAVKDIPIWNFHGERDDIEPVATSRRMIRAIEKAGGHPIYTEYAGVGHNVFMWAYTEPALLEWLFSQQR